MYPLIWTSWIHFHTTGTTLTVREGELNDWRPDDGSEIIYIERLNFIQYSASQLNGFDVRPSSDVWLIDWARKPPRPRGVPDEESGRRRPTPRNNVLACSSPPRYTETVVVLK